MSDLIERQAAIDVERNATVDTNPSHFEAHQKFTQFMDDAEISSFGRWQWSNGFNTALTAVGIDLKKLPSAQPEPLPTASPWRRVEEPPKDACDCLVCWTTIHDAETGEVTGHGFWCEKGWYEDGLLGEVGFYCQSRKEEHPVRVEPDYWMPIEPPKEEA